MSVLSFLQLYVELYFAIDLVIANIRSPYVQAIITQLCLGPSPLLE